MCKYYFTLLYGNWFINIIRGYEVNITVGGEVVKVKLIKFINSLFVHFIMIVSDSTSWLGQIFRLHLKPTILMALEWTKN